MSDKKKNGGKPEEPKLSSAVVKKITDIAAIAAVNAYREEKEKDRAAFKDKRFNNTKLLLRKYRELSAYTRNAVYEASQLLDNDTESILEAFGAEMNEIRQVHSIRKNVAITKVIMEHVTKMLDYYRDYCTKASKPEVKRRWRVICQMFLAEEPFTAQEIANVEHISLSMVYNVVDTACDELSTLFFGLDLTSM